MDAMPDSTVLETRETLLAKAAQAWVVDEPDSDHAALGGDDGVLCFLRSYYNRVATEDLASPSRLAAVAEAHARLATTRPQGRALIQVREPGNAHLDPVSPSSLVVDTGRLGAEGRLILYVVPAAGGELDDDLAARLRAALRSQLSPRHVPDEIHQVPGIPRTLSGKKLEVPVRKILLGTEPERAADPNALANPEVLAYFVMTDPPQLP